MPYELTVTPKGIKTLTYSDSTKKIRLHSAYSPENEAQRLVAQWDADTSKSILVLGLGLGYHVQAIKDYYPDQQILILEKDKEVITLTREHFPQVLENVTIIQNPLEISAIFEEIDISTFRGFSIFYHRPSYTIDKNFYDNIIVDINKYVSSKISDLLTRFEFEERWVANILSNIPHIFSSHSIHEFFGKFQDYPGIIVSAGPSLRKNIQYLREIKDKALIVCVDTALKVMLRSGITPHIVMVLDAQKHSLKHFLGIQSYSPILLADLVSYPKVLQTYQGNKIMSTTSKYFNDVHGSLKRETTPFVDWLEQYITPVGDIQSGGSVATSLFDLLLNLGCSQIILVGQDLAYTGREIHSSGTYHNDEWLPMTNRFKNLDTINQNIIRKRHIQHIDAFGKQSTVVSDFVLNLYRGWFEDSVLKVRLPVVNATEGGAYIANTREQSLQDLIGTLPSQKKTPQEILHTILTTRTIQKKDSLQKGLNIAINQLITLKTMTETYVSDQKLYAPILEASTCKELSSILAPFLKKTLTYINRHPELKKAAKETLLIKEIKRASSILISLMNTCLKRLSAPL